MAAERIDVGRIAGNLRSANFKHHAEEAANALEELASRNAELMDGRGWSPGHVGQATGIRDVEALFDWILTHKASVLDGMSRREASEFTEALGKARISLSAGDARTRSSKSREGAGH